MRRKAITRTQTLVIAAIIVVVILSSFALVEVTRPKGPKILKAAIGADLDTLDPHDQTTSIVWNVMIQSYETLFKLNEKGEIVPWLATGFEASPDAKVFTIKLRKDVKFHDGATFTAEVLKANWDRIFDPKAKKRTSTDYGPVDKWEAVDQFTFRVTLKEPFIPFLSGLATSGGVTSKQNIDTSGQKLKSAVEAVVGTGPYRMTEWAKGTRAVFERFDGYWGEKPKLDKIIFQIVPEDASREAMLLAGDVDIAFFPPSSSLPRLQSDPKFSAIVKPTTRYVMYHFNLLDERFQDVRVRQAFNYAIDKETIIKKIFQGLASPVKAPWQIGFFGYKEFGFYEYNVEKARQLLKEAGWTPGPDGILTHPKFGKFEIKLVHMTGRFAGDKELAETVQGYLRAIGVKAELVTGDWPWYLNTIYSGPEEKIAKGYSLFQRSWGASQNDPYATVYPLYSTGNWVGPTGREFSGVKLTAAGRNIGYYSNPRVDELIRLASSTSDTQTRTRYLDELGDIMWKEAPAVYMFQLSLYITTANKVTGVQFFPSEYFDLRWADLR